jgi:predicted PurR-regulated permease PerM
MEYLIIGIVSAFNMLVIKFKLDRKRYEDAMFDTALMFLLSYLFSGSYGGMVVAMVASLVISIYLFISPPTFTNKARKFFSEQWDDFNAELEGRKKTPTPEAFDL